MANECATCFKFKAYYSKAYCNYSKEDCGRCFLTNEVVSKHSTCDKWRSKSYLKFPVRKGIIMREMEDVLTKLSVIKDFIDDHSD